MLAFVPTARDPHTPPCPKCKVPLHGIAGQGTGACNACATELEFVLFPALRRPKQAVRVQRSLDGEATCFFHAQNQAASVCESCGRYVCAVCEVSSDQGEKLCPPCISAGRKKKSSKADELVSYDSIAIRLAVLPLLAWPVTLVTAPIALFMAIYGWKKPRSLVRPGCARFVCTLIIAGVQISVWVTLGLVLWAKR